MIDPKFQCRVIFEEDWAAILQIQSEVYYEFAPESETVMRSKVTRGPTTSFVAVDQYSAIIAYCLAHPYQANRTPVLGTLDNSVSMPTDNLFLHDLAVKQTSSGRGVAKSLFNHLLIVAKSEGYRSMSLVAVQQAASFWTKIGFLPSTRVTINNSYTGDATFMTRSL